MEGVLPSFANIELNLNSGSGPLFVSNKRYRAQFTTFLSLLTQNIDKSYRISCVKCHQEISSYIFLAFDSGIGEMAEASVYVIIPGIVDRLGDERCTCFIYLGFKLLLNCCDSKVIPSSLIIDWHSLMQNLHLIS